ncbi:MAG TPA: apolipoprotein N-acyltransferase [Syntrophorhabdales bacterium]|nr:apolipoprotein N-acyltransferase [Syntrophorhabdales bacterium]
MSATINFIKSRQFSLPLASAVLLVASQPPISLFPLAYVALVPLLFSLEKSKPRDNFLAGFITGIMAYAGLVYWVVIAMNTYGGISIPLAILILALLVLYLALYLGLITWLCPLAETAARVPLYLSVPLLWVICEYWRGWFLTGFPWSYLAHSQHNFLPMIQIASLTGTYFISFLIAGVNVVIFSFLRRKPAPALFTGSLAVLIVASLLFGYVRLQDQPEGALKTAIIQGNILQDVKWDEPFKLKTVDIYARLTLKEAHGADLIVWPETAMPFVFDADPIRNVVSKVPEALNTRLLFGTLYRDGQGRFYNAAYVLGQKGQVVGRYEKVHLVPFGEFTPLRDYFPFLERISVATGDFFSGSGHNPLATDLGKIGLLICYEGVFPYVTVDTARRGAQVFVNITNDAWFGRSSAPYQHLAFYTFRAIETDRFVLRAANTGISAIIDPRGRITARTDLFTRGVLQGTFAMRDGTTFYVKHGDYFVLLCIVVLSGLILRGLLSPKSGTKR